MTIELMIAGQAKTATFSGNGTPEELCARYADLHGVTVTAWRYPRVELVIGVDPRNIVG